MRKIYWHGIRVIKKENGMVWSQQLGTHKDDGDSPVVEETEISKSLKGVYRTEYVGGLDVKCDDAIPDYVMEKIINLQRVGIYNVDFSYLIKKYHNCDDGYYRQDEYR